MLKGFYVTLMVGAVVPLPEEINEIDDPLLIVDPEYPAQPTVLIYFRRSEGDTDTLAAFVQI